MSFELFFNISKEGNFLDICWWVRYYLKIKSKLWYIFFCIFQHLLWPPLNICAFILRILDTCTWSGAYGDVLSIKLTTKSRRYLFTSDACDRTSVCVRLAWVGAFFEHDFWFILNGTHNCVHISSMTLFNCDNSLASYFCILSSFKALSVFFTY